MTNFNVEIKPYLTLSQHNALCNLIHIDDLTLLFDCGWNESFSEDILTIYKEQINFKIDYIFVSNNFISSFGGLPIILKNEINKDVQIYATTPIAKLGFYVMADAYISKMETSEKFTTFTDADFSSGFFNINEVKFKENIKLPHKNSEIVITPLPSGNSLGGCCWKISYKLYQIVYAPQFSIDSKYITDPFPYQMLKGTDCFLTDTMCASKMSLVKNVIETELKKNIVDGIEKLKNIFIPSDSVNINLELLIKLEKILDEYFLTKQEKNYKVLVCGYCSNEIVESVKSLIEFMGTSISQQFYSYCDNPFNFQYVQCIKDMKEWNEIKEKKGLKYIMTASFESLDIGMSYKMLPEILKDPDWRILIVSKSHKNSLLRDLVKKVKDGSRTFEYKDIKIKVDPIISSSSKANEIIPGRIQNFQTESSKQVNMNHEGKAFHLNPSDLSIKKKLFAKSPYPMFAYHQKKKLNDYGIELTEKEIKIMKSTSEEQTEVFASSFKAFLYADPTNQENFKQSEFRIKLKRPEPSQSMHYEEQVLQIPLKAKFFFFEIFNHIDLISKEYIITEIHPRAEVIFLGEIKEPKLQIQKRFIPSFEKMINHIESSLKIHCCVMSLQSMKKIIQVKDNLLNFKYDSVILNKVTRLPIKEYGNIYEFKNTLLRIKSKRNHIIDITLYDQKDDTASISDQSLLNMNKKTTVMDSQESPDDELNSFYSKSDVKLINIKRELSKLLNEELFIQKNYITNSRKDFFIYLNKGELVLEGNFSSAYYTVRNCIYSHYMDLEDS